MIHFVLLGTPKSIGIICIYIYNILLDDQNVSTLEFNISFSQLDILSSFFVLKKNTKYCKTIIVTLKNTLFFSYFRREEMKDRKP